MTELACRVAGRSREEIRGASLPTGERVLLLHSIHEYASRATSYPPPVPPASPLLPPTRSRHGGEEEPGSIRRKGAVPDDWGRFSQFRLTETCARRPPPSRIEHGRPRTPHRRPRHPRRHPRHGRSPLGLALAAPALRCWCWGQPPVHLPGVELPRPRDLGDLLRGHLLPLRHPAHSPCHREQHSVHGHGDPHGPQHNPRVEVHVGIQAPLDKVLVRESNLLQLHRDLEKLVAAPAKMGEHLVADAFHDLRTRVVGFVHPVAEAHEAERVGLVFGAGEALWDACHSPDLSQHRQHRLIRSPVRGPPQRGHP
mmetsp:Transcript_45572/g.145077  ORF Transcript_45572/g.145077 Transcript_45572/m.145077 type:complete len:311 (+) Transcript_45572:353-1285(+)